MTHVGEVEDVIAELEILAKEWIQEVRAWGLGSCFGPIRGDMPLKGTKWALFWGSG